MPNCDSVMEGVYATRQRISARYGNDPDRYIAAIRNKTAAANDLGISYLDYCVREVLANEDAARSPGNDREVKGEVRFADGFVMLHKEQ